MLPTLIGIVRGVDRLALVFLVNLIGAPTGIGWIAAMILAFGPRRLPPGPLRRPYPAGAHNTARINDAGLMECPVAAKRRHGASAGPEQGLDMRESARRG